MPNETEKNTEMNENKENTQDSLKGLMTMVESSFSDISDRIKKLESSIPDTVTAKINERDNTRAEEETERKRLDSMSAKEKKQEENEILKNRILDLESKVSQTEQKAKDVMRDNLISDGLAKAKVNPVLSAGAMHEIKTILSESPHLEVSDVIAEWSKSDSGKAYLMPVSRSGSSIPGGSTGHVPRIDVEDVEKMSDAQRTQHEADAISEYLFQ